ncbi:MAG: DUF86 domain-containing protein [Ignavibacteriaceae bacterium]|nr:DUF86 domain-containing protein [Ignavibacteriaceae bacterium]
MPRDPAYFLDILESAKMAVNYLLNVSLEEFLGNYLIQDAVIRRIEIIGEASARVSQESKKKYSHLPWKEMKGMRNLLIHEYDDINLDEVWNTVKNELPGLIKQIEELI